MIDWGIVVVLGLCFAFAMCLKYSNEMPTETTRLIVVWIGVSLGLSALWLVGLKGLSVYGEGLILLAPLVATGTAAICLVRQLLKLQTEARRR